MELIKNFKKNRAIKSYIKKLPSLLAKDYGASKTYTPMQVRKTIERSGLSVDYSCYAIAMFSNRELFDEYHQETGENCDYDAMRTDIANQHFHGDAEFSSSDISALSYDSGGLDSAGFDGGGSDVGGSDGDGGGSD